MSTLPKIIGITGSMGSGKSTVSKILSKMYPVLDLDQVNARLIEKGNPGFLAIREMDPEVFENGILDKKKLAVKMFSDPVYKREIEHRLHPLILAEMDSWVHTCHEPVVVVEVPLLFENGLEELFDEVWMVDTNLDNALERLEKYRGYTPEEAQARIRSQMDPKEKARRSDVVINNNKSPEDLEKRILLETDSFEKRWKIER